MNHMTKNTDYTRVEVNFKTLRVFLQDLKTQMSMDLPDVYLRLQQADNADVGQSFLSTLFWSAFDLIATIEAMPGKEFISWFLGSIIEDIHDHADKYPDLNRELSQFIERYLLTLDAIEGEISKVISDPAGNWDKAFTYKNHVVKVSDFDTFDFVYGDSSYQLAQVVVQKECKRLALKNCFPYEKWKIGFWFAESPQKNPCKQCNWGCDYYEDLRGFFETTEDARCFIEKAIAGTRAGYLYVIEPVKAINCRFAKYTPNGDLLNPDDVRREHPNGVYCSEYCLVSGRDDFLNDWGEFDQDVAKWMFVDDGVGNVINPNGFVDRNDFYFNWELDASGCLWKRQYPPDPNMC